MGFAPGYGDSIGINPASRPDFQQAGELAVVAIFVNELPAHCASTLEAARPCENRRSGRR